MCGASIILPRNESHNNRSLYIQQTDLQTSWPTINLCALTLHTHTTHPTDQLTSIPVLDSHWATIPPNTYGNECRAALSECMTISNPFLRVVVEHSRWLAWVLLAASNPTKSNPFASLPATITMCLSHGTSPVAVSISSIATHHHKQHFTTQLPPRTLTFTLDTQGLQLSHSSQHYFDCFFAYFTDLLVARP